MTSISRQLKRMKYASSVETVLDRFQEESSEISKGRLERLPKELVWMIVEYATETVHELRLVR